MIAPAADILASFYHRYNTLSTYLSSHFHQKKIGHVERGGLRAAMQLRNRLAELRRDRGWTLRALRERVLERTGAVLSISYLSELERTDALPSLEMLARLARAYDLSPQDLLAPVDLPAGDPALGEAGGAAGGAAGGGDALAQYPPGLRALIARGTVTPEWAGTLARIEFRGQRPRSEDEWQAIYGLLKVFLDPATAGEARAVPAADLAGDGDLMGDASGGDE